MRAVLVEIKIVRKPLARNRDNKRLTPVSNHAMPARDCEKSFGRGVKPRSAARGGVRPLGQSAEREKLEARAGFEPASDGFTNQHYFA